MKPYRSFLSKYFLKYTAISSQSCESNAELPSSQGQWDLVHQIQKDLQALGVNHIHLDDSGILTARIKGSLSGSSAAFIAHVDTVDIGASPNVKAQLLKYEGKDIILNPERNIVFKAGEHPEAQAHIGDEIFFSDGTSVLGADDKAGVAVLTALAQYLIQEQPPHSGVTLVYLPDEEIGLRGAYALDPARVPAQFCYTIDASGGLGRFACETFNAARAKITIEGYSVHPGQAKGLLVNPLIVAADIMNRFDPLDTPEHSEGRQGYFWFHKIEGNPCKLVLDLNIRDFDLEAFQKRKEAVVAIIEKTRKAFPRAVIDCDISDEYANIGNNLSCKAPHITLAETAFALAGISMDRQLSRGGTDGSVLSAKGLPAPNIFTGGYRAHSLFEFLPLSSLEKSFEVCVHIALEAHKYQP